ncbi:MAG: hypothetical protein CL796_03405 [Chloroflexi bacterium]|nr:hypothetical protein [Chloroflexota bacterium]
MNISNRREEINTETINTALNLTIFGIAISFILLSVLIIFITLIKFIENKLSKINLKKNDPNYKKVLAASVAVSIVESELQNFK